jgi:DNA-binding NarL/FixJ family response regulator
MLIVDEIQRAHRRCLERLQVRTVHEREHHYFDPHAGCQGPPPLAVTLRRHALIVELHAKGLSREDIALQVGVTRPTVNLHLRGGIKACR